jgi:hypothetical protein
MKADSVRKTESAPIDRVKKSCTGKTITKDRKALIVPAMRANQRLRLRV